jgi:ribosomal protein S18 acetylase RimI-like enzyme
MISEETILKFNAKNGKNVILRTPRWEDLDDFVVFINSLVEEGAEIMVHTLVTKEQEAKWLKQKMIDIEEGNVFCLVSEVDGKVIANSEIRKHSGYSSHTGILGIAIMDGYRDIGIGTKMLETLILQAKSWGLTYIELYVFGTNKRAIHVYNKLGFKEVGRKKNFILKRGEYIDHVNMILEI